MIRDFPKDIWKRLTHAQGDQTSPTAMEIAYSGTWASAAQNPTIKPSYAKQITTEAEYVDLMFVVADTADDKSTCVIWFWAPGNGPAIYAGTVNPIQAGASICEIDPYNNESLQHLVFTSGGTAAVAVGDTVEGATGGATATVDRVTLTSGTWAGGDAAGSLFVSSISGTFESENLDTTTQANIATIAAAHADFYYADVLTVSANQWPFMEYDGVADGIAYLRIPVFGCSWILGDIDQNLAATAGTDTIIYYRETQGPYIASAAD